MFDCTNGNILQGLEFFLSQIMIPALKSQQVIKRSVFFSQEHVEVRHVAAAVLFVHQLDLEQRI